MKLIKFAIATAALAAAFPANSAIVVDGSPTGSYYRTWINITNGQNYLVKFTLAAATNITGFDIFTNNSFGPIGQAVRMRIRADAGGSPLAANLFSFDDTIDVSTPFSGGQKIVGTNFAAITLGTGTYWIGMSGLTSELGWSSFNNGGPLQNPNQRELLGEVVNNTPVIYDLGFRIRGDDVTGAVPEPSTWLMLLFGFGAIGASLRYRRGRTTVNFA